MGRQHARHRLGGAVAAGQRGTGFPKIIDVQLYTLEGRAECEGKTIHTSHFATLRKKKIARWYILYSARKVANAVMKSTCRICIHFWPCNLCGGRAFLTKIRGEEALNYVVGGFHFLGHKWTPRLWALILTHSLISFGPLLRKRLSVHARLLAFQYQLCLLMYARPKLDILAATRGNRGRAKPMSKRVNLSTYVYLR